MRYRMRVLARKIIYHYCWFCRTRKATGERGLCRKCTDSNADANHVPFDKISDKLGEMITELDTHMENLKKL